MNFGSFFSQFRRLAILHVTVLCLIAFFTISRQVLVQKMLDEQASTNQTIGTIGHQELYVQQLSKDVMAFEMVQNPALQKSYLADLHRILPQWIQLQHSLQPLKSAQNLPWFMRNDVPKSFVAAQPDFQTITTSVQTILSGKQQYSHNELVNTVIQHEKHYTSNMEHLLIFYYIDSQMHMTMLNNVEIICFVLTLVILLLEVFVVFRPIMARMFQLIRTLSQTAESLRTNEERVHTLLTHAPVIMFTIDMQGICTFVEGNNIKALGTTSEALVGQAVVDVMRFDPAYCQRVHLALSGDSSRSLVTFNGFVFETMLNPIYNQEGAQTGVIGVSTDITERVRAEEALHHQLLHDALTDLPNRNLLLERLDQSLQDALLKQESQALLLLDLDHFKDINDTFGHHYGDLLLQQVATRLRSVLEKDLTVARLGGDEFAVLLPGIGADTIEASIESIRSILEAPFSIAEHLLHVKPSIGAVIAPEHGSDGLTLLRHADVAMYRAKQNHSDYELYDLSYEQEGVCRLALLGALRDAIGKQQMQLNYQPKIDSKSGQISGVEALLRWQHPVYGFIAPDKFIPLAEQSGMISQLTLWVLETALKQAADWQGMGHHLSMAVNLSMLDLQDRLLPEHIATLLHRYQFPASLLHLELTESALMTNPDQALLILEQLSSLGVCISVDDFGTGYSSLAYLKRLPVNELKIDRSFVQHMATVKEDATIVQSTVALAHNLGLRVVAEGVEDLATSQLLSHLKCDTMQGYYFARPLSAHALEQWLDDGKQNIA